MGDEGEFWNDVREADKERKARNLSAANPDGWTAHTEFHWSRTLQGKRLDYWPSRNKFQHNGRVMCGDVNGYIKKREGEAVKYSDETISAIEAATLDFGSRFLLNEDVVREVLEALESTNEQKALRNAPARDVTFNHEIHTNPRADAWAAYFAAVYPNCNVPQDVMLGWFANAMMAMHDFLKGGGPINGDHAQFLQDRAIDKAREA